MTEGELQVRKTTSGLEVRLHVQPRAKHPEISGIHNGALKVKVTAPPVDDAANRAIVQYFAKLLGLPKSSVRIVSGLKSRDKTLQIAGISFPAFLSLLQISTRGQAPQLKISTAVPDPELWKSCGNCSGLGKAKS